LLQLQGCFSAGGSSVADAVVCGITRTGKQPEELKAQRDATCCMLLLTGLVRQHHIDAPGTANRMKCT
jgi:hypothetical protein